jgi:SAM-dependent methyltransferase
MIIAEIVDKLKPNSEYEIQDGKYVFEKMEFSDIDDKLDRLKSFLKKYDRLYQVLIELISPVYITGIASSFLRENLDKNSLILNIGSGNSKISPGVINVDIFAYPNVDIVCNIHDLPFEDNTVDAILNIAVLEHVANPEKVISELFRVLKPHGNIFTAFPFMQGYHASPYDFTRVTSEGIKILHGEFLLKSVEPFGGPTSGFLWVFQEWLSILLSFGSKRLHQILYILVMVFTFPLKFLDILLIRHPMAKNISSGFVYIGTKPSSEELVKD